jgi:PHP family Zn ribbon phosphoesterase
MLGSKTGYDSLEACFGENASSIHAIETGLSSDPAMNWRVGEFESRQVVSFSDAHSGPKMGREATVFEGKEEYEYNDLIGALAGEPEAGLKIVYTIEYFPEEGKYHWTGHRECDVCYSPDEERAKGLVCPVCGRQLTSGVEHRVDVLATKPKKVSFSLRGELLYGESEQKAPFVSMIPLLEILQEVLKSKAKSEREYTRLTELAPEFEWLLRMSLPEIEKDGGEVLAKAIASVRKREVVIKPGFDGVFGSVTIPQ